MNISTGYNTPIIALVRSTSSYGRIIGQLSIFNLESGQHERAFPVRYDLGGKRLSLSRDSQFCFVGCYKAQGLAAYSIWDGSELWRRRDLKAVQYVDTFTFDDAVFCGREGAGYLLNARNGHTLERVRGVRRVYSSPFNRSVLVSARTLDIHSPFGTRIGKIERIVFSELDCCFSDGEILISEVGGALRCYDLNTFELLWSCIPQEGSHYLRLCFSQPLGCFLGVWWHYIDRTIPMMRIDQFERRSGAILKNIPIGTSTEHEFCLEGTALFTSDLQLLSVETGNVMHEFRMSRIDESPT